MWLSVISTNVCDTQLIGIYGRYSTWKELISIKLSPLQGLFLNNTIVRKHSKEDNKMFGNNRREFVILLVKQPKCKSELLSLSLLKK